MANALGHVVGAIQTLAERAYSQNCSLVVSDIITSPDVIKNLCFFAGAGLLQYVGGSIATLADHKLSNRLEERMLEKTGKTIEGQSLQKITGASFRKTLDLTQRQSYRIYQSVQGQLGIASGLFTTLFTGLAVAASSPMAAGFLLVASVPYLMTNRKNAKSQVEFSKSFGEEWRHIHAEQFDLAEKKHLQELKTLGLVRNWNKSIKERTEKINEVREKVHTENFMRSSRSEIALQVGMLGALISAAGSALSGKFDAGLVTKMFALCREFSYGLKMFIDSSAQQSENITFVKDIRTFVETKPETSQAEKQHLPIVAAPGIELDTVSFTYEERSTDPKTEDQRKNVLHEVSLKIDPGEYIGLVGENGAGKTTLVNLMIGLLDHDMQPAMTAVPANGANQASGITYQLNDRKHDICHKNMDRLREEIGCLHQEYTIFSGKTIRENITTDLKNKNKAEAAGANSPQLSLAQVLGYSGLIESLDLNPEDPASDRKLDYPIGNWFTDGIDLSGGQRQLVAFARTIYRGGKLFIFDEPTAHLDPWNSKKVLDTIRDLPEIFAHPVTRIIITHNYFILARTDRNITLEKSGNTSSGTHQELLEKSEFYREGYNTFTLSEDSDLKK